MILHLIFNIFVAYPKHTYWKIGTFLTPIKGYNHLFLFKSLHEERLMFETDFSGVWFEDCNKEGVEGEVS